MKYAIIESGSKQYRVSEGEEIDVELLDVKKTLTIKEVLLVADGEDLKIGTPYVTGAKVSFDVVDPRIKGEKLVVFKYKSKSNYDKKTGHRQKYTRLKVKEILLR